MKGDNFLLTIAVIAVAFSIISAGVTYLSVSNLVGKISGYATSGQANLTIESAAIINFTTDFINWGSGRVNLGQNNAQLTTLETNNVTNGNWTLQQAGGFRIENIGNVNVTLSLTAGKTAAQFLGGTNPGYQWNVSAVEASSCINSTGTGTANQPLNIWYDVNTTAGGTRFCTYFNYLDTRDLVRIDLNLTVPYNSLLGALTDTITASAATSP